MPENKETMLQKEYEKKELFERFHGNKGSFKSESETLNKERQ